jgi:hypothetical protein
MKTRRIVLLLVMIGAALVGGAAADGAGTEAGNLKEPSKEKGLQQRIEFGSAYILGQSIKSGAVYLLHRKQSDIKGMLEVRQNYREEIKQDFALEETALVPQSKDASPVPGPTQARAPNGSMEDKPRQGQVR